MRDIGLKHQLGDKENGVSNHYLNKMDSMISKEIEFPLRVMHSMKEPKKLYLMTDEMMKPC